MSFLEINSNSRAGEHIAQFGLLEYIETRLSDRLEALSSGEGDILCYCRQWRTFEFL